jgi:hypothetical protein
LKHSSPRSFLFTALPESTICVAADARAGSCRERGQHCRRDSGAAGTAAWRGTAPHGCPQEAGGARFAAAARDERHAARRAGG